MMHSFTSFTGHFHTWTTRNTVKVKLFGLSSAFSKFQLALKREKLEGARVNSHLTVRTINDLTNGLQYVRLQDCGELQVTKPCPLLFSLYTSGFRYTMNCHLQMFSNDTAITGYVSEGNNLE